MLTSNRHTGPGDPRNPISSTTFFAISLAIYLITPDAHAQTTFDFAPLGTGNSFETATNWNPSGPPGENDTAQFGSLAFPSYSVLFNSSPQNGAFRVVNGNVVFQPILSFQAINHVYALSRTSDVDGAELTVRGNGNETLTIDVNGVFSDLIVGRSAGAALNVFDGGAVDLENDVVAENGGAINVSGAGAWLRSEFVDVGRSSTGSMNILDGGGVSQTSASVGRIAGSAGHVTLDGVGSSWSTMVATIVGGGGSGTLQIRNGASATTPTFVVGQNGGLGNVTVGDANSALDVANFLDVLNGTVSIAPGGTVRVGGTTIVRPGGQLRLVGGTLETPLLSDQFGLGEFAWESGLLSITGPQGVTIGSDLYHFANNTVVLGPNSSLAVTHDLTVPAATQLFMTGGNLNAGTAEVEAGGELFLSRGQHDVGAGLTNRGSVIFNHATIDGPVTSPAGSDITVLGDVAFNDLVGGAGGFFGPGTAIFNGGHSPGDSPAVVPVEGNLVYGDLNELTIELGGLLSGEFDRLEILGDAMLDGNLLIDLLQSYSPSFGDQFEIFNVGGTLSGQFAGLGEGALFNADGQQFQISYFGGDGNDVVLTAVPEPGSFVLFVFGLVTLQRVPQTRSPGRSLPD